MIEYKLLGEKGTKMAVIRAEKYIREDRFYKFYLNASVFARFDDEIIKGIMIKRKG